ncbi:MAG: response regulator [Acidobacteria bacterium]|nr:response regulator [Acidobacteriota bacterium]
MKKEAQTILVVDDDEGIRETVRDVLEREDYRVIEAESPAKAIELAINDDVSAFLLDFEMRGMTGPELCLKLRNIDRYKSTPIIFVTGIGEEAGLGAAFEAGGDDFISKPFSPMVLYARLKGHLQRAEYFKQLERTRRTMNQYLSRRTLELVDKVSRTGILPPPEEGEIAICFTDIRGFTAFSEDMESGLLFSLVSSLLAEQVDLIHHYGGYVDKFGGDGVMAIFDGPGMVLQSCLCALKILDGSIARLREGGEGIWKCGIGIHTGRAMLGNIGSPEHLDYSAIGPSVNLAARLCGQAEATSIVVSEVVRDAVAGDPRLNFHTKRQVPIRGVKAPVTIYTLSRAD